MVGDGNGKGGGATRPLDGTWAPLALTRYFSRLVPVEGAALVFNDLSAAARISEQGRVTTIAPPPTVLEGRIRVRGDEVWALGSQGLVRFKIPPP